MPGAELTWDGDISAGGLQDGGGTWNTTDTLRWYKAAAPAGYQAWSNAAPDYAIFGAAGGPGGTVTLAEPITAAGLRFDAAGYTLAGNTLTLAGAAAITTNSDAIISSVLAGTDGLAKDGAGTLRLTGSSSNTFTGLTVINGGTLSLGKSGSAVAVGGNIQINTGGTLVWEASGQVDAATSLAVAGGTVNFSNRSMTLASYTQTAGGQLTSGGNYGTVVITGTLAMSGGSVLTLNSSGQWSVGAVDFTGYTTGGNVLLLASDSASVITRFTIGSGGLTMSGQTVMLNRPVSAGVLGNELVLNGDVAASGTNSITYSTSAAKTAGSVNQINMGAATRTWSITSGTTTANLAVVGTAGITKTGDGTLTLAGADANTYSGLTTVNGGTFSMGKTAGVNAVGGNILVSSGTLKWDQHNQVPDDATITVEGGLTLNLGNRNETFANYTQTGGVGFSSGSSNAGMVTITGLARISGGGGINVNSGGQMSIYQADFTGYTGTAIVVGGSSLVRVSSMTIGAGGITLGTGQSITLAKSDATGSPNNAQGSELILNGSFTASGTTSINTNSGLYGVAQINLGAEARTFNITSGTTTSSVPLVGTGGVNKTGAGNLALSTTSTYTGKTTVAQGALVMGAAGSIASSSWVQIDAGASFTTSSISGGHVFSGSTVISGSGAITGSVQMGGTSQIRPGTTSDAGNAGTAGDGAGTLAVSGALVFTPAAAATVAQFQIFGSGTADKITVGGALTLNASSNMAVAFSGGYVPAWGDSWELIDWGGVLTPGGFSTGTNLRTGADADANEGNLDLPDLSVYGSGHVWQVSNFSGSGSLIITVVPEPCRMLLLAVGAAACLWRRQRQRRLGS